MAHHRLLQLNIDIAVMQPLVSGAAKRSMGTIEVTVREALNQAIDEENGA